MGYDLRRSREAISLSQFTWIRAYALAIEGGWEPEGTYPPKHWENKYGAWSKVYYGNDGQRVSARDAANMAAALELMLPALNPNKAYRESPDDPALLFGTRVDAVSYFSAPGKRKLLDLLIAFLKEGEFEIQ